MVPAWAVAQKCQLPLLDIHLDQYSFQYGFVYSLHLDPERKMSEECPFPAHQAPAKYSYAQVIVPQT